MNRTILSLLRMSVKYCWHWNVHVREVKYHLIIEVSKLTCKMPFEAVHNNYYQPSFEVLMYMLSQTKDEWHYSTLQLNIFRVRILKKTQDENECLSVSYYDSIILCRLVTRAYSWERINVAVPSCFPVCVEYNVPHNDWLLVIQWT